MGINSFEIRRTKQLKHASHKSCFWNLWHSSIHKLKVRAKNFPSVWLPSQAINATIFVTCGICNYHVPTTCHPSPSASSILHNHAMPHLFPISLSSLLCRSHCRLRLGGGARHQRGASGRHAARQQQRQLPAPPASHVRAFCLCCQDGDDGGGCRLELQLQLLWHWWLELELELEHPSPLQLELDVEQSGRQSYDGWSLELELMQQCSILNANRWTLNAERHGPGLVGTGPAPPQVHLMSAEERVLRTSVHIQCVL